MSNRTKTYFLVPGWDMTPSAIRLGSIIAEPTLPHLPIPYSQPPGLLSDTAISTPTTVALIQSSPSTTTPSTSDPDLRIDTEIHTNTKIDFTLVLSKSNTHKYGLFFQFLHLLGVGAEAGIDLNTSGTDTFTFESETEEWFVPSMQFVKQSIEQPAVQMFLKGSPSRTPLYIVTGLRMAKGITAGTIVKKERMIGGQVSVDATGAGVPLNVGPTLQNSKGTGEEIQWKCEGPLVFAYQLARIKPNKADWTAKSYKKGAFFGTEQEQEDVEIGMDVDIREGVEDMDGTPRVVVAPLN
jgi:hypothetical protein